jgi:hypothetical protein
VTEGSNPSKSNKWPWSACRAAPRFVANPPTPESPLRPLNRPRSEDIFTTYVGERVDVFVFGVRVPAKLDRFFHKSDLNPPRQQTRKNPSSLTARPSTQTKTASSATLAMPAGMDPDGALKDTTDRAFKYPMTYG